MNPRNSSFGVVAASNLRNQARSFTIQTHATVVEQQTRRLEGAVPVMGVQVQILPVA